MMNIFDSAFTHCDRVILDISVNREQKNENCFVLSKDSTLSTKYGLWDGCFGAYIHEEFNIKGNYVLIKIGGINFLRTIVSTIDPASSGDLSYIDGCSNSCIISPPRNGDPCVNYLYFPKNINQTSHTHPSVRIGVVLAGKGTAHVNGDIIPLNMGTTFLLNRHTLHSFSTADSDMSLAVFHPDSDAGPTDEFNAMKTRTYIQK